MVRRPSELGPRRIDEVVAGQQVAVRQPIDRDVRPQPRRFIGDRGRLALGAKLNAREVVVAEFGSGQPGVQLLLEVLSVRQLDRGRRTAEQIQRQLHFEQLGPVGHAHRRVAGSEREEEVGVLHQRLAHPRPRAGQRCDHAQVLKQRVGRVELEGARAAVEHALVELVEAGAGEGDARGAGARSRRPHEDQVVHVEVAIHSGNRRVVREPDRDVVIAGGEGGNGEDRLRRVGSQVADHPRLEGRSVDDQIHVGADAAGEAGVGADGDVVAAGSGGIEGGGQGPVGEQQVPAGGRLA